MQTPEQAQVNRDVLERLYLLEQEELRRLEDRALYRFKPNRRQIEFANRVKDYAEVNLTGGNQLGKTTIASSVTAIHALGDYDEFPWYEGQRYSGDIVILCASTKMTKTELVMGSKLFGEYLGYDDNRQRQRTNGLIPKHRVEHLDYGISDNRPVVTRAVVKRADGGRAIIYFWAYSQNKENLQSLTANFVWLDEEPELDIYNEFLARTNFTHGPVILTMCPNQGRTRLLVMFNQRTGNRVRIKYGIDHADHLSEEEKQALKDRYKDNPAELPSLYGEEVAGIGLAYPRARQRALCKRFDIPDHWPRVIGYDIPHATGAGTSGHFAAVWIALDPDSAQDKRKMKRYVYRAYKASGLSVHEYAAACKGQGRWGEKIPGAMPHDAGRAAQNMGVNPGNASKWREIYEDVGLNLIPIPAGFVMDDGHISRDPMIAIEENNIFINEDRLRIFDCPETELLLREMDDYYIDEDMRPAKKQDDHCCDALTKATFMVDEAEPLDEDEWYQPREETYDFDVFLN